MTCCACGENAGRFAQHWNRDTGFGVCRGCVARQRGSGVSEAELLELYGVEGVNYAGADRDAEGRSIPPVKWTEETARQRVGGTWGS